MARKLQNYHASIVPAHDSHFPCRPRATQRLDLHGLGIPFFPSRVHESCLKHRRGELVGSDDPCWVTRMKTKRRAMATFGGVNRQFGSPGLMLRIFFYYGLRITSTVPKKTLVKKITLGQFDGPFYQTGSFSKRSGCCFCTHAITKNSFRCPCIGRLALADFCSGCPWRHGCRCWRPVG